MEERRRATDPLLIQVHSDLQEMRSMQQEQAEKLKEVAEILTVWNNTKGFVKTIRVIGEVAKWCVLVGTAIATVWWWVRKS